MAALIILLIVFGAVVAGVVPTLMGIVSIVMALGAVAVVGQLFSFSFFVDRYMPIVFVLVLGTSFVLLTVVFRSIVVALKAIVMNLLSVGAAYGLLVLVFQQGVGASVLGFRQGEAIADWIPLFLFSVLFGLSMLLDATIVRTVLVPASMKLLGTRNWYLPGWLGWLPELHAEGTDDPAEQPHSPARLPVPVADGDDRGADPDPRRRRRPERTILQRPSSRTPMYGQGRA